MSVIVPLKMPFQQCTCHRSKVRYKVFGVSNCIVGFPKLWIAQKSVAICGENLVTAYYILLLTPLPESRILLSVSLSPLPFLCMHSGRGMHSQASCAIPLTSVILQLKRSAIGRALTFLLTLWARLALRQMYVEALKQPYYMYAATYACMRDSFGSKRVKKESMKRRLCCVTTFNRLPESASSKKSRRLCDSL